MLKLFVATSLACLSIAGAALAQDGGETTSQRDEQQRDVTRVQPGRVSDGNQSSSDDRRNNRARAQAAAAPTPEQVAAEAAPLVAASAPQCQMTESALLGAREDGTKLYEVACATGPGYIIEAAAAAPKANDCVLQWSYGQLAREADPAADVGLQCRLPGNQNNVGVIAAYGREAGLECEVDQAVATAQGVYEIGCAARDGWRLEKTEAGWKPMSCWQFSLLADAACRYSSREEMSAEWPKLVAGTDAAACDIQDVAWIGDNPERGSFYELKCASGDGIIVRFKDGAGQQTYSCIDAQQIFRRDCALTPPAAAAASGGRA